VTIRLIKTFVQSRAGAGRLDERSDMQHGLNREGSPQSDAQTRFVTAFNFVKAFAYRYQLGEFAPYSSSQGRLIL